MINVKENENFILFSSNEEKLKKLKEWRLITNKAKTVKQFMYKGFYLQGECVCEIVGYIPKKTNLGCIDSIYETAVIEVNGENHKINIAYLKQMQDKNFSRFSSDEKE